MLNDLEWVADSWDDATDFAVEETGLSKDMLPEECPWSMSDVLDDTWLPEDFS